MQTFAAFFDLMMILFVIFLEILFETAFQINNCLFGSELTPETVSGEFETNLKRNNDSRPFRIAILPKRPMRTTKRGKRDLQLDIKERIKSTNIFSALADLEEF